MHLESWVQSWLNSFNCLHQTSFNAKLLLITSNIFYFLYFLKAFEAKSKNQIHQAKNQNSQADSLKAPESACVQECFMSVHTPWNNQLNRMKLSKHMSRVVKGQLMPALRSKANMPSVTTECKPTNQVVSKSCAMTAVPARMSEDECEFLPEVAALQASEEQCAHAILDTGASRCII